ncbi:glycine zipper 2TM domain-containing protein [Luteimonas deserti]|uniref:Glycine zipper 2TM domain-containing protein n=1 Tax=Luteimonas deserti TaxID=2752306 RepID=A0A7Z0QST8_9GAMM|nr:glycine zipper 2TM domain-containing protein [Luteimonas deserti]NYZ63286.1 glycine zipper 2TM domain-containing protein [Luteimonas deserti]
MHPIRTVASIAVLATLGLASAHAQTYGPQDEGRRFNDGSRVVCQDVEVRRADSDPNRVGGTAAGAVIGGLVGNQIGSGSGRRIATVGGAVAGGAIGRNVQGNSQEARGDRIVESRCERVYR